MAEHADSFHESVSAVAGTELLVFGARPRVGKTFAKLLPMCNFESDQQQDMRIEQQVRDSVHDHLSRCVANAWATFFFDCMAREKRRAEYLTFMKHRNRRGANVRIGVEQRKAKKRAEARNLLRSACIWMREDIERKRDSEDRNAG